MSIASTMSAVGLGTIFVYTHSACICMGGMERVNILVLFLPLSSPAFASQHTAHILTGHERCGGLLHSDWDQGEESERTSEIAQFYVSLICVCSTTVCVYRCFH